MFTNKVIQFTQVQNGHKIYTTVPVDVFFKRLHLGNCSLQYAMDKYRKQNFGHNVQFTKCY